MTVLFDLDNCLCNLLSPWLEEYNRRFDDNLKREDITEWEIRPFLKPEARTGFFKIINEEGFYKKVKPIEDFISMAKCFVEGGHEVGVLTSCNSSPNMINGKIEWLGKHCNFIPKENWMFCCNKGLARADMLIDDRVKNIEDFLVNNEHAQGYIVRTYANSKDIEKNYGRPLF